jgi:hypothetical protein
MCPNLELETDAVDADTLAEYDIEFNACNAFAFWYVENVNENAVVKDAIVGNIEHAFVYDPDLDVTIDATLGQFDGDFGLDVGHAGAWDGDHHPHINHDDEVHEWESRDAFNDHYDEMRNFVSYVVR